MKRIVIGIISTSLNERLLLASVLAACVATVSTGLAAQTANAQYVAHEWGTFTSVQGGDGKLQPWRPLETSKLPRFVYDWRRPGPGRVSAGELAPGKGDMLTLQRMETPVIYFYSQQEQSVDVIVRFPKGLITEWYPQADQIGPFTTDPSCFTPTWGHAEPPSETKPGPLAVGADRTTVESLARWTRVEILPRAQDNYLKSLLSLDSSGSHYFAARDTDANYVRVGPAAAGQPEIEKFLFYRGAGNFETPLRVTASSSNDLILINGGQETLKHLLVVRVQDRAGEFVTVDFLRPGESRLVKIDLQRDTLPTKALTAKAAAQMQQGLAAEGLDSQEAAAMVRTWQDSWFEENGLRVLYVLPGAWTDRVLPLTLNPAPRALVRVMVGRAEILAPELEKSLAENIAKTSQGDGVARSQVLSDLRRLGRFAEPALRLALTRADPEQTQQAWLLLSEAAQSSPGKL